MKLTSNLNFTMDNRNLQFGVELEFDDDADMAEISSKTNKAVAALKTMVNEAMTLSQPKTIFTDVQASKQLSTGPATSGQLKFLKDLTGKCNTTLKKWCQSKGVDESSITGGHCQKWIPELQEKIKDNFF